MDIDDSVLRSLQWIWDLVLVISSNNNILLLLLAITFLRQNINESIFFVILQIDFMPVSTLYFYKKVCVT